MLAWEGVTELQHAIDFGKWLKDKAPILNQACHTATLLGLWKEELALFISKSYYCVPSIGVKIKKKSEPGAAVSVGNGTQAAVEAIGMFDLVLPSGLVLKLNNCYYAPSIVRGVVSLSCLLDLGFHHTIASNGISVSLNGIFYFSAISVNGVFEIDINNNVPKNNNNSIFSINKKRKLDLDSSYLWHCRLAHIGKTRMQKLHREGLLENIDEESFDKCESCISGKMTKKPFNKNIERATDLLGLIHTDVCGPLRHVSRKGFQCRSRIAIGKKIKALRSDREFSWRDYDLEDDHMDTFRLKTLAKFQLELKVWVLHRIILSVDEEKAYMKKVPYASAVGSIMYAVRCTRPDVVFAQNLVSRYQQNPRKLHWVAVKHILKYLRNTKDMFLVYGGIRTELEEPSTVRAKADKPFALIATQLSTWTASEAAMEAVWMRKFVGDLGS
ncbi:retrotransposon protein, putative, ty1-copia subclass [Tanacetum coccineum]